MLPAQSNPVPELRTDPVTLSMYILQQQHIQACTPLPPQQLLKLSLLSRRTLIHAAKSSGEQAPHARGSLSILLNAICVACKFVEAAVRKVYGCRFVAVGGYR